MATAVFNDFSALVKGMTIDDAHVYLWGNVASPWSVETAGYSGGICRQIQVCSVGFGMVGSFPLPDGSIISWVIIPNGATFDWQLTAQPIGGTEIFRSGTF